MAEALTPVRIGRASRSSFQDTEESAEIDFQLGVRQGIVLHAFEFGVANAQHVATSDDRQDYAFLSLHAETGELENVADGYADALVLNSEVLGEAVLAASSSGTAGEETGVKLAWLSTYSWRMADLMGKPLLLASNLTFRGVTTDAQLTINGAFVRFYYQYVELTKAELADQFILRR